MNRNKYLIFLLKKENSKLLGSYFSDCILLIQPYSNYPHPPLDCLYCVHTFDNESRFLTANFLKKSFKEKRKQQIYGLVAQLV